MKSDGAVLTSARRLVEATALVNEAFLRLVDGQHVDWQNRTHFLAMSARLMRRVLVDLARYGTAATLKVSSKAVLRDWECARALPPARIGPRGRM
jgi:RNA polymerase sigma-70 factor (ECF subfamily)